MHFQILARETWAEVGLDQVLFHIDRQWQVTQCTMVLYVVLGSKDHIISLVAGSPPHRSGPHLDLWHAHHYWGYYRTHSTCQTISMDSEIEETRRFL